MQKKRAFRIDTSSSGGEDDEDTPDNDLDMHGRSPLFDEMSQKCLMKADFKNNTDRRLLLGLMFRNNDMVPYLKQSHGGGHGDTTTP